ncbi:DUF1127 domain-containing protein [Chelatococcus asaccharovorans]|nr:DUF1127 domain-containing protein [Chelatococcus asaccharovorans]MBS7702285.1 DUF1127 domain-containing protein [Chelatococcus asaccharovorans]
MKNILCSDSSVSAILRLHPERGTERLRPCLRFAWERDGARLSALDHRNGRIGSMGDVLLSESSSLSHGRSRDHIGSASAWTARFQRWGWGVAYQIARMARALRHRREVWQLTEFDERALHDIGLTRSDVVGALAEPLKSDPSVILAERAEKRMRKPLRRP